LLEKGKKIVHTWYKHQRKHNLYTKFIDIFSQK